ncbi:hypothetical protein C2E23DRAFT_389524 [Lenzites betulinus]|nr:hypothetical protein C2E23DRAFT_389524 [Lenzites betulinus]
MPSARKGGRPQNTGRVRDGCLRGYRPAAAERQKAESMRNLGVESDARERIRAASER